ncbi:hypothetical protein DICVIV_01540 [Dictyocaulus viviparus]|uniref:Uncharacterized protein n=1 Tax=Dictyocaulus viviparus TaxID=29172 RepID=A0A0D8Y7Q8_DICVI|nr:hypothetical protein DICVIV_01540 [Dictyocaulus viviparus]
MQMVFWKWTMRSVDAAGNTFQYAEMNIRHTGNPEKTLSMVRRSVKMGYDTVVINIDIGDTVSAENAVRVAKKSEKRYDFARKETIAGAETREILYHGNYLLLLHDGVISTFKLSLTTEFQESHILSSESVDDSLKPPPRKSQKN